MSEIQERPEYTVYDTDRGFYFVPFIATDGRVGYRVQATDRPGRETFIYMNPSTGGDTGNDMTPDVFIYEGIENDPTLDASVSFVVPEAIL